jgi:hypothetical protein
VRELPTVSLFFIFAHDCILVYYNSLIKNKNKN